MGLYKTGYTPDYPLFVLLYEGDNPHRDPRQESGLSPGGNHN
jgi:hypothetical protein